MTTCTVAEFAARHGVSLVSVYNWRDRGWVVDGPEKGTLDLEASDARLALYRDPHDGRALRGNAAVAPPVSPAAPRLLPEPPVTAPAAPALPVVPFLPEPTGGAETPEAQADIDTLISQGRAPKLEAARVKENFLAAQARLKFEQDAGNLVPLDVATSVVFEAAQANRNAWMGWPTDAGPRMAADLGIEVDVLVPILTRYVHQHLTQLGEPEVEFAR